MASAARVPRFVLVSSTSVYGFPARLPVTEEHPYAPRTAVGRGQGRGRDARPPRRAGLGSSALRRPADRRLRSGWARRPARPDGLGHPARCRPWGPATTSCTCRTWTTWSRGRGSPPRAPRRTTSTSSSGPGGDRSWPASPTSSREPSTAPRRASAYPTASRAPSRPSSTSPRTAASPSAGVRLRIRHDQLDEMTLSIAFDIAKARRRLGFAPRVGYEEGVARTLLGVWPDVARAGASP